MATRATIKIQDVNYAKIYKHWDGYPDALLPFLEAFNTDFEKERGHDPTYKFAQLLRATHRLADKFGLDNSTYTGYGVIASNDDCGAAYEYTLHTDGSVTVKNLI